MTSVVIIGGGIAGNTAAFAIRKIRKDAHITLISSDSFPLYSACVLPHYLAGEIEKSKVLLAKEKLYVERDINLILGQKVEGVDVKFGKVILGKEEKIPFDKLIIATGSEPIAPPIEGLEKEGVFQLKWLADVEAISHYSAKAPVVIGSGLVGLETAIALKKRGYRVSVIEALDWILPRLFDEKASQLLARVIQNKGVRIFSGENVKKIVGDEKAKGLVTERREIDCDMAIVAAGMKPNVDLAAQAGIRIGETGGIWTDEKMQTSVENIYACGDCVEARDRITGNITLSLFWHNAREQGLVAGQNSIGVRRQYTGSQNMAAVNIFGIFALSIGSNMSTLRDEKVKSREWQFANGYRRLIHKDRMMLGAQIVAEDRIDRYIGTLFGAIQRGDDFEKTYDLLLRKRRIIPHLIPTIRY